MEGIFKYDVAISFAEEDRNAALALALALEIAGVKNVYYYPVQYEATWGTDLEEKLKAIYSIEARYVVVLFSKDYLKKEFAQIEMTAILQRAVDSKPVVTMLPVLLKKIQKQRELVFFKYGYVEWRYDPVNIAKIACKVLGKDYEVLKQLAKGSNPQIIILKDNIISAKDFHIGNQGIVSGISGIKVTVEGNTITTEKFHIGNRDK